MPRIPINQAELKRLQGLMQEVNGLLEIEASDSGASDASASSTMGEHYDSRAADYNDSFGSGQPLAPIEENMMMDTIKRAIEQHKTLDPKNKKPFRLCFFGIGSGREFPIAIKTAEILKKEGIALEVYAYDISAGMLEILVNMIKGKPYGFTLDESQSSYKRRSRDGQVFGYFESSHGLDNPLEPYSAGTWKKDNMSVRVVHAAPQNIRKLLTQEEGNSRVIPPCAVTLANFGPLAHIPGQEARIEALKVLQELTLFETASSVPSRGKFKTEKEFLRLLANLGQDPVRVSYNVARQEGDAIYLADKPGALIRQMMRGILKMVKGYNPADIEETPDLKTLIENVNVVLQSKGIYMHTYVQDEFRKEHTDAGWTVDFLGPLNVIPPRDISNSRNCRAPMGLLDRVFATVLGICCGTDRKACYGSVSSIANPADKIPDYIGIQARSIHAIQQPAVGTGRSCW